MNETLGNGTFVASTPVASDDGNQFSRANVVGMFLTLQLCQLTQPYGSLLFRGVSGFFWRCNPISSFVEACIIYRHLGAVLLRSWKDGRKAMLKELQEVSGGLLLLRGAMGKDDVGGLMQMLMAGSFLDDEERVDPPVSRNSGALSEGEGGVVVTGIQSAAPPPVSRQPTLEANRPSRRSSILAAHDPAARKSQILREAFGSNALAHKELRIDLFTAFTELTIIIKLIAVRGSGWFTAGGFFLVLGWSAVHTLLLLFHRREMSEMEMATAVRIARTLNAELKEQARGWSNLFMALHLPFFGYPAYLISFHPWYSQDATGFVGFIQDFGSTLRLLISISAAIFATFGGLVLTISGLIGIPGAWKLLFLVTFPIFCAWLTVASISYFQRSCGDARKYCVENYSTFFEPQTLMYYIFDESFEALYNSVLMLLLLTVVSAIYFNIIMDNKESDISANLSSTSTKRNWSSLGNNLFVLVLFVFYLYWYEPSGSSKPAWTDFLG